MTPTRTSLLGCVALALALAACSKEAPTSSPAQAPSPVAESASSPLPGVIGQPSDATANQTPNSPAAGNTAVGELTTQAQNGTTRTGGTPAPTGGDAAPAASSAGH